MNEKSFSFYTFLRRGNCEEISRVSKSIMKQWGKKIKLFVGDMMRKKRKVLNSQKKKRLNLQATKDSFFLVGLKFL